MAASIGEINSIEDFSQLLRKTGRHLVVCHFCADWAPQCKQITDVLKELCKDTQYINCRFVEVAAEDVPELSLKYDISAVPTCVLIKNGDIVARVNGANAAELTQKVAAHGAGATAAVHVIGSPTPANNHVDNAPSPPTENLKSRLKQLVNSAPAVLFMKGSKTEPRCGFSRQTLTLLDECGADYTTFDILQDEAVRQGLKVYSDWPTYPQLYMGGELVGGLDILREMKAAGELADLLPKPAALDDRLRTLVRRSEVMVFMKGSRTEPRCGFSKKLVEMLNSTDIPYDTFDILQDEEVRQGLKKLSDWPTYPQVYVEGELVGGLDILVELQAAGDLQATLSGRT